MHSDEETDKETSIGIMQKLMSNEDSVTIVLTPTGCWSKSVLAHVWSLSRNRYSLPVRA